MTRVLEHLELNNTSH